MHLISANQKRKAAPADILPLQQHDNVPNNGTILNTSQIIKSVMSLAAEAELGALYLNTRKAVPFQTLLDNWATKSPPPQSKPTIALPWAS